MSRRITVQFPSGRDNDFYTRVFCWADDTLYPEIDQKGFGRIEDLDRVRETVRIEIYKKSDLGSIRSLIKRTLPRHFPNGEGVIHDDTP